MPFFLIMQDSHFVSKRGRNQKIPRADHRTYINQKQASSKATLHAYAREASAAPAASLCAGHAQQLGGESPLANLMEVKA